jgi:hypothetical protein
LQPHGLLVKVDSSGKALWNKTYQGEGYNFIYSIQNASDGGYTMEGATGSPSIDGGNYHFWLVKTDSQTSVVWVKILL